jgi:hypothetical protein
VVRIEPVNKSLTSWVSNITRKSQATSSGARVSHRQSCLRPEQRRGEEVNPPPAALAFMSLDPTRPDGSGMVILEPDHSLRTKGPGERGRSHCGNAETLPADAVT